MQQHAHIYHACTRNWQDDDETLSSTPSSFASGVVREALAEAPAVSEPVGVSPPRAEQPVEAPETLAEQPSSSVGPGLNTVTVGCLKDESAVDGQEPRGAELMRNLASPMKNGNSHAFACKKSPCMHACIYMYI